MILMLLVVLLRTALKAVLLDFGCNFSSLCKDYRAVKIVSILVFRRTQPEEITILLCP